MGMKKSQASKCTDTFLQKPAVPSAGFITLLLVFLSGDERSGALTGYEAKTATKRLFGGLLHALAKGTGGFSIPIAVVTTWACSWPGIQQERPHAWFGVKALNGCCVVC